MPRPISDFRLFHRMISILWISIVTAHLCLVIIMTVAFSKYRKPRHKERPKLSIVIAARNEAENLQRLIPALLEQDYPAFDIIVSLDQCTDDSHTVLQSFPTDRIQTIDTTQIPNGWNSKKYVLTQAAEIAFGEWLVFTDADCLPAGNQWLQEISQGMGANKRIVIGASPYLEDKSFLSRFIRFESFQTFFQYGAAKLLGRPYMAVGRNMAIRKSFFFACGGYAPFRSVTGGDDDLFIQRNATDEKTSLVLSPAALVWTYPEKTWRDYFAQKKRHLSVGQSYQNSSRITIGIYQFFHSLSIGLIPFVWLNAWFLWVYLFYLFAKFVCYWVTSRRTGFDFNYFLLPIVDMIYAVLIPTIALGAKLEKDNIKWKN